MPDLIVKIPFSGFYESFWSAGIDSEEEQFCEHEAEDRQVEDGIPEELRLTACQFAEILFDVTDYRECYHHVARQYVDAFDTIVSTAIGFNLGLRYESMSSPRFYNFETDRLFAYMPETTARRLFALSAENDHARLREIIADRHTSRSGFISLYTNDAGEWLARDVTKWDHNELETLLLATLPEFSDLDTEIYETVEFYTAHEAGVDWGAFDAKVREARERLEDEARESDPDYVPHYAYRCDKTPDMFADYRPA